MNLFKVVLFLGTKVPVAEEMRFSKAVGNADSTSFIG
jgi:hypothetical protein